MEKQNKQERDEVFRAKLNLETGEISWKELERFFAGGYAFHVSPELDLVEVAFQVSEDNKKQVENWLIAGQLGRVTDEQARAWHEAEAMVWAIVLSPYVFIQGSEKS